jgi:hypothetical protein
MKLDKPLLQAMAVAITVAAASSCKDKVVDPKEKQGETQTIPYNCPACGMG